MDSTFMLLALISTIPSLFKKTILQHLITTEYYLLNLIFTIIATIINIAYGKNALNEKIDLFGKIKKNKNILLFMSFIIIIKFVTGYQKTALFKKNALSKFTPIYKGLYVFFSFS